MVDKKKSNPWVSALKEKKAAVDLHPDVLRAVLAINPGMRADRSTHEVSQDLLDSVRKPAAPAPQAAFSDGKFRNVLNDMLKDFTTELQNGLQGIEAKRAALMKEEQQLKEGFVERLVEFFAEVQPGPLSPTAREVLRQHHDLVRKLNIQLDELSRTIKKRSDDY